MNVSELLSALPPMKMRYYSISSAPCVMPRTCSITVGVVAGTSPTGRVHKGCCSNYMADRRRGDVIWAQVKNMAGTFNLPAPEVPIIMVGPGTGVAPFRGFLQERQNQKENGAQVAPAHLFFGCQTPDRYFYEDEFKAFEQNGTLTKIHVAYSRVAEKKYVQRDIAENAQAMWELLDAGGHVYMCGDAAKVAPAVRQAFKECVVVGGEDKESAATYVEQMLSPAAQRYHEDCWSAP